MSETIEMPKPKPLYVDRRRRSLSPPKNKISNRESNKLQAGDRAVHQWYRFILSFPPHLVRNYITKFGLNSTDTVLDPFCGTGTTVVECRKLGIPSIGLESNPVVHFASQTKLCWNVAPNALLKHALKVAETAGRTLERQGLGENEQQR